MPKRKQMFDALMAELEKQIGDSPVNILYHQLPGNIGERRQVLLESATGEYICYHDDDDWPAENYVSSILSALSESPDCVGMKGIMTTNGKDAQDWEISYKHQVWSQVGNTYYRHTNHLTPVKRSIALQVGFKPLQHGEDYQYSMGLVGRLKSEVMIPHAIYHYQYISKK